MNPTDIYRTFHPNTKEYTFFSAPQGTVLKIDHILGHKANLRRYKKTETRPCILSDHHGLKLGINGNRNNGKLTNPWKLKNNWIRMGEDRNKKLECSVDICWVHLVNNICEFQCFCLVFIWMTYLFIGENTVLKFPTSNNVSMCDLSLNNVSFTNVGTLVFGAWMLGTETLSWIFPFMSIKCPFPSLLINFEVYCLRY